MNKKMKIITLILSCVLLIGAVVGITVSAEQNAPTVKIAGQNISYEGAVRVAYYLSTDSLAEGQKVKLLVSSVKFDVPENITNPVDYVVKDVEDQVQFKDEKGNVTATYDIAYSDGVLPKAMRDDIYALAVVVDEATGEVVARSSKKVYSPYTYAMNRFNGESTDDQYGLYTALLNYGAAVQAVLGYNAEDGKWADEYIVVDQVTYTDGVEANTSFAIRGTTLENPVEYIYEAARWQQANAEKEIAENKSIIFTGFTKADGSSYLGEKYAANWNKIKLTPGNYTINANYKTSAGQYVDYDGYIDEDATSLNDYKEEFFVGAASGTNISNTSNSDTLQTTKVGNYTYTYIARGQAYINADGKLVYEKIMSITEVTDGTTTYNKVGEGFEDSQKVGEPINADHKGMVNAYIYNTTTTKPDPLAATRVHVVEFDLKADYTLPASGHIGQFWLTLKVGNSEEYLWGLDFSAKKDSYALNFANATNNATTNAWDFHTGDLATNISRGEVHNIRIEAHNDWNGEGSMLFLLYIDGVLSAHSINYYQAYTLSYLDDNTLSYLKFGIPQNGKDVRFSIDNTYIATEYRDDYLGIGKYTGVISTEDYESGDTDKVYLRGTQTTAATRYENTDFLTDSRYMGYVFAEEDGNTFLKYAVKNESNNSDAVVTPLIYSENKVGDTYVFATDFRWDGAALAAQESSTSSNWSTTPWYLRFGFRSVGSTTGGDDTMIYLHASSTQGAAAGEPTPGVSPDDLYLLPNDKSDENTAFAVLERGVWYNLRLEYTPTACTGNITDGFKISGRMEVYINGVLAHTYTHDNKSEPTCSNLTFDHVYIQGRGATNSDKYGVRDYSYCLDNTYCDAITKNTDAASEKNDPINGDGYKGGLEYNMDSLAIANDGFVFSGGGVDAMKLDGSDRGSTWGVTDWARIATEGDNKVLEMAKQTSNERFVTYSSANTTGDMYVFSTDLKWMGTDVMHSVVGGTERYNDQWLVKIGMIPVGGEGDNNLLPIYGWAYGEESLVLRLGIGAKAPVLAVIESYRWHNLTVEYFPLKNGNEFCGKVVVKIDGDIVYNDVYSGKSDIDNSDYSGAFINFRGAARDCRIRLDNTYVGAISTRATDSENAVSFTEGTDYSEKVTFVQADYANSRVEAIDGDNALIVERHHDTNVKDSATADFINVGNNLGNTYVFDTAIRYDSTATWIQDKGKDNWVTKLTFDGRGSSNTSFATFYQMFLYPVYGTDDKVSYFELKSDANVLATIPSDCWNKLRVEYSPVTSTTGDVKVYLNGQFVGEQNDVATVSGTNNGIYRRVHVEQRIYCSHVSTAFDNVVVGIADELVHQATASFNGDGTDTLTYKVDRAGIEFTETEEGYLNFTAEKGGVNTATGNWRLTFNLADPTLLGKTQLGSVYTIEYKLRMNEIDNYDDDSLDTTWWSYGGITANGATTWKESDSAFATNGLNTSNVAGIGGINIKNGEWITVRQTFKVTAVDADGDYTIQCTTYVNGALASTSKTGDSTNAKVDSRKFICGDVLCFGFQFRGMDTGSYKMDKINVDFDDFVFSAYNTVVTPAEPPEETPAE